MNPSPPPRTVTTPWQNRKGLCFWPSPSHGWHCFFPHFLFFLKPHLAPVTSSLTFKWAWSAWTFVLEVLGDGQTLLSGCSQRVCRFALSNSFQTTKLWSFDFFFLIHKLHQFTQIIWKMFGETAQFLSKTITHITSKQNKKYICGRFVSYQKDRGSFFPPYTMEVVSYHRYMRSFCLIFSEEEEDQLWGAHGGWKFVWSKLSCKL